MATRGRAYNYTLDRPPLPLSCRTPERTPGGSSQVHNNEPSDDDDAVLTTREPSATAPMIPLRSRLSNSSSSGSGGGDGNGGGQL